MPTSSPRRQMVEMEEVKAEMAEMAEVKAKVLKGLEVARWRLLDQSPFTGEMVLRFQMVPTYDVGNSTAATDGTKIYFDCDFYSKLTPEERVFVLAHEVWHNIFLHFSRKHGRDDYLWNVATDCEINHMLQNEGLAVPKDVCLPDAEVAGLSAEDIYAHLQKEQRKQNQKNQSQGGSQGQGNSQGQNEGQQDQNGNSSPKGNSSPNGNSQGGSPFQRSGNGPSGRPGQFDRHLAPGERPDPSQSSPSQGKFGPRSQDPDFTPGNSGSPREVEDKIKDSIVAAAQSIQRRQGHLPAGVRSMVEELLRPEIDWREALGQFVTKCIGGEQKSWKRCSRHALARGEYLQGRSDEKIRVAVAVDTSGSCLGDIPKFLGELDGLLNSFGKRELTLIQCDAEVQKVDRYGDDDQLDAKKFEVAGFGGTSFKPPFKWLRENGQEDIDCMVYLTDGYGDAPTYPPPYPVLWVLTSDGCSDFCEWGEKMRFDPSRGKRD